MLGPVEDVLHPQVTLRQQSADLSPGYQTLSIATLFPTEPQ